MTDQHDNFNDSYNGPHNDQYNRPSGDSGEGSNNSSNTNSNDQDNTSRGRRPQRGAGQRRRFADQRLSIDMDFRDRDDDRMDQPPLRQEGQSAPRRMDSRIDSRTTNRPDGTNDRYSDRPTRPQDMRRRMDSRNDRSDSTDRNDRNDRITSRNDRIVDRSTENRSTENNSQNTNNPANNPPNAVSNPSNASRGQYARDPNRFNGNPPGNPNARPSNRPSSRPTGQISRTMNENGDNPDNSVNSNGRTRNTNPNRTNPSRATLNSTSQNSTNPNNTNPNNSDPGRSNANRAQPNNGPRNPGQRNPVNVQPRRNNSQLERIERMRQLQQRWQDRDSDPAAAAGSNANNGMNNNVNNAANNARRPSRNGHVNGSVNGGANSNVSRNPNRNAPRSMNDNTNTSGSGVRRGVDNRTRSRPDSRTDTRPNSRLYPRAVPPAEPDIVERLNARRNNTDAEIDTIREFEDRYYEDTPTTERAEARFYADYDPDNDGYAHTRKEIDPRLTRYDTPPDALIIPSPTPPIKPRRGETPIMSWWKQRFVAALSGKLDDPERLERGLKYAVDGHVTVLEVSGGTAYTRVQGSSPRPYRTMVTVKPFSDEQWAKLYRAMRREAKYPAMIMSGDLPTEIDGLFQREIGTPLFPTSPTEIGFACNCPDATVPCKHCLAAFFILAEEIERDPLVMFHLRGSSRREALDLLSLTEAEIAARRLDSNLINFYGLRASVPKINPPDMSDIPLGAQLGEEVSEDLREEVVDFYRAAAQLGIVHLMADFWLEAAAQSGMSRSRGR